MWDMVTILNILTNVLGKMYFTLLNLNNDKTRLVMHQLAIIPYCRPVLFTLHYLYSVGLGTVSLD